MHPCILRAISPLSALLLLAPAAPSAQEPQLPPVTPVPTAAQLAWQALEVSAFVDLRRAGCDAEAVAGACVEAGLDAVLVAPGAGPAALERALPMAAACTAAGLPLGLVIDLEDEDLAAQVQHVEELLAALGPVHSVAFERPADPGRPRVPRELEEAVRALRPGAVVCGPLGPDARTLRAAEVAEVHWATLRKGNLPRDEVLPTVLRAGDEDGARWVPAQARFVLADDPAEAERLAAAHAASVGRGATLRIDLPLAQDGRVAAGALRALASWRAAAGAAQGNLALDARAAATQVLGGPAGEAAWGAARARDGDPETAWAPAAPRGGALLLEFPAEVAVDHVRLREALAHGQRVRDFAIDVQTPQGGWLTVVRGGTIGARRDVGFDPVRTSRLRLRLIAARATPALAEVELLRSPPRASLATASRPFLGSLDVALETDSPWAELRYTTDGSDPHPESTVYEAPLRLTRTTTLRARAFESGSSGSSGSGGPVAEGTFVAVSSASLKPAVAFFREPDPGLRFAVYSDDLAQLDGAQPARRGVTTGLEQDARTADEMGALRLEGHFRAPADGVYGFRLGAVASAASSGEVVAALEVAGQRVAEAGATDMGFAALAAGWHPLRLELAGAARLPLELEVEGPELDGAGLPAELLFQ